MNMQRFVVLHRPEEGPPWWGHPVSSLPAHSDDSHFCGRFLTKQSEKCEIVLDLKGGQASIFCDFLPSSPSRNSFFQNIYFDFFFSLGNIIQIGYVTHVL